MNSRNYPTSSVLTLFIYFFLSTFSVSAADELTLFNCAGNALTCNDNVRASINPGCEGFISIDGFLENPCYGTGVSYEFEARISSTVVRQTISATTAASLSSGISVDTDLIDCRKTYSLKVTRRSASGTQACAGTVTFQDNTPPVIYAADNQTVALCSAVSDQDLLESINISIVDFCHVDQTSIDIGNFPSNFCNGASATIPVTIEATDFCGNTAKKTIDIRVTRPTVYFFPGDSLLTCGTNTDPSRAGYPSLDIDNDGRGEIAIDGSDCGFQASYSDIALNSGCGGSGSKILRTWKVTDVCNLSNSQTQTQLIEIRDTERPTFTCPTTNGIGSRNQPYIVQANAFDCQAIPQFSNLTVTDNCSSSLVPEILRIESLYNSANVYWPNDALPTGKYKGNFQAVDACGNRSAICTIYFDVVASSTPTALCDDQINVSFANGWTQIRAIDLDEGSFDLCGDVSFSVKKDGGEWADAISYTCDDVRNNAKVHLRVENTHGISTTCWVKIGGDYACGVISVNTEEDDNETNSNTNTSDTGTNNDSSTNTTTNTETETVSTPTYDVNDVARLKGAIYTINDEPLPGVSILAEGGSVDYSKNSTTDEEGVFSMFLPKNIGYTIIPNKDEDMTNGISILDLILITRHILGLQVFLDPYQYLAADANLSGTVSAFDLAILRKLILDDKDPSLENMKGWRFVEKDVELDLRNPLSLLIQENSLVDMLTNDRLDLAFTAIKVGDLNNTAVTSGVVSTTARNTTQKLPILIEDQEVIKGTIVDIPMSIAAIKEVLGLQLSLQTKGLRMLGVTGGIVTSSHFQLKDANNLSLAWDTYSAGTPTDESFLKLTVEVERSGRLSDLIQIVDNGMPAVAYTQEETELYPSLSFINTASSNPSFALLSNQPNPFDQETTIGVELPATQAVALEVYDTNGRLLFEQQYQGQKGLNSFTLKRADLDASGVLVYKISTVSGVLAGKLMVL